MSLVKPILALIFFTLGSSSLFAGELYNSHLNVRALGMGGAYISVVDDAESLFFNPAGLAKNTGFFWKIMDPKIGASDPESLTQLTNLQTAGSFASTIRQLYGKNLFVGGGGQSAVTTPFVSASLYYDTNVNLRFSNPPNPEMAVNYINDTGVAAGFGFHILPALQMGLAVRKFTRTGVRKTYGVATIGALDPTVFDADLNSAGAGLALDMGINISFGAIVNPTLSFVWRDIGRTTIEPDATATEAPPNDEEEMIVGASIAIDTPIVSVVPTLDFRYLNRNDIQLGKKLNFGVEFDFPLVDIRGGFSQGYYTLGATVSLGLIRVDAATWGVELGEAPGQIEDRRYMVQATMELGFDPGFGFTGGSGSGKGGGGGSSAARRGLKRRR